MNEFNVLMKLIQKVDLTPIGESFSITLIEKQFLQKFLLELAENNSHCWLCGCLTDKDQDDLISIHNLNCEFLQNLSQN